MKHTIRPFLNGEEKYRVLLDEIMAMHLSQLNEAISGMEAVFSGKWLVNSFCGQHMACVEYGKQNAKITYFDELIGEEPTVEIYNMLKAYRDKLKEYEIDTIILNNNETPNLEDEIVIRENTIKQSDIQDIIDAFQVASGQSYALKNTEKILLMIEKYNCIEILKVDNYIIKVSNPEDLSEYILSIDEYVDLKKMNELKRFFS